MRFENCIRVDTKLRLQNIISKTALFYGSETYTINRRRKN